ncbi:MAG: amino acid ABC transporter permease [Kineosporiaceae bacterium]|nr:amino acid ABC transporter permease [Kineosporiaceae bacterium]
MADHQRRRQGAVLTPGTTEVHDGQAWTPSGVEQARRAFRRRQQRRSWLIAAASTMALGVAAVLAITSAPGWPRVQRSFFDPATAWRALPDVATGLWLNVRLFLICGACIVVLGLVIAVLRTLRGPVLWPLRALATVYVDLFRGLPLILVLLLIGFGVPGLRLSGVTNSVVILGGAALVLSYSAYVAEVFRAGIESIHPSQRAAARALGLSGAQTMRHVVLPQAVRRVVPPLLNDFVSLQKDSGLVSILGAADAIQSAQIITARTFNFTPYVVAGLLFVALTVPMARLTDAVSRRYGYLPGGGLL